MYECMTDEWRQLSILVAKLLFCHDILQQPLVSLSDLLGGINVGNHDMSETSPYFVDMYIFLSYCTSLCASHKMASLPMELAVMMS